MRDVMRRYGRPDALLLLYDGNAGVRCYRDGRECAAPRTPLEEGLRAGLDMNAGGTLARDLHELYHYLVMRLTLANLRNDDKLLTECQQLMKPLHEAWLQIADEPAAR